MTDSTTRNLLEAVEDLERRLAPDDALRCVTNALREWDEHLEKATILGAARTPPVTWTRFVALGNVDGQPHPCYGVYPGLVDDEDRREIERIGDVLKRRKVAPYFVEDILSLKASGTRTAAIALLGEDARGAAVLMIGRHPDVTLPQAICLVLAAVMSADIDQVRKN